MSADCPTSLRHRLPPAAVNYRTDRFSLKDDLDHLDEVQRAAAPEAVIFYCARILEVLAADALQAVNLPASTNLFANLDALQQFNLIRTTTRYWAHALRRSGNLVRHIERPVQAVEADCSILFVERWLHWFFHQFRYGRRLPPTPAVPPSPAQDDRERLRCLIEAMDAEDLNPLTLVKQLCAGGSGFLWTAALPAVLAEMLLDRNECSAACEVLEAGLHCFSSDLRLIQLKGLYLSRTGNLTEALKVLEPLFARHATDEETAGILAGVYKRRWVKEPQQTKWLVDSQRLYRRGWDRSNKTNFYLGINGASMALLLGRPEEARQLAADIDFRLQRRSAALAVHRDDPDLRLNYWDQVTWAEAKLLMGDFAAARDRYMAAFANHGEKQSSITVSKTQLEQILRALGSPASADAFLHDPPIPPGQSG